MSTPNRNQNRTPNRTPNRNQNETPNPNQLPNTNLFGSFGDFPLTNLFGGLTGSPSQQFPQNQQPTIGFSSFSQPLPPLTFEQQQLYAAILQQQQQQQPLQQLLALQLQNQLRQEQSIPNEESGSSKKKRSHKKKDQAEPKAKGKKTPWSKHEEVWLAHCWIDSSEDPIVGNSQRYTKLWETVMEKFNNNEHGWSRKEDQLSGKWRYITKDCKEFNGFYREMERQWPSGSNDEDVYKQAELKFLHLNKVEFKYRHCWEFLKDKPKWYAPPGVGGTSANAFDVDNIDDLEFGTDPVGTQPEMYGRDHIPRPMGRDAARKASRNSKSSDAATSSRGKSSGGSSKMDEWIDESRQYKESKQSQLSSLVEEEKWRSAMKATKYLAEMSSMKISDPVEKKRAMKMKSQLLNRYKEYIEISDDEVEDEDEDEDEDDE